MKRIAVIIGLIACTAVVAVLGTGASNDDSSGNYRVRAIFDSAFSVIPGEDVKVAGVKVGKIESLSVTPQKKAAVVLRIDKPGFGDFRDDASCSIRPQSLIGEKFVDCTPTQPRPAGQAASPALRKIEDGDGKGQYLLPVTNTTRTVDIDLLNNVLRMPYRQRLSIIINEFGAGLAGRGADLNQVIRRADPALQETDKVLKILSEQNRVLAGLARDGDTNLAPLAQRRQQVADFIVKAGNVAQATAERRDDLESQFAKFPAFLTELRPTLDRIGSFSDQATPVLRDLDAQAPAITRLVEQLGPFSEAGRESFPSLGDAADVGREASIKIKPITEDVRRLAQSTLPVADDLEALLSSFRDSGGIERLMDYLFFQVTAINGFDSAGHYLRAGLLVNLCSTYSVKPATGCEATFPKGGSSATSARAARVPDDLRRSLYLRREQRILQGDDPKGVLRALPDTDTKGRNRDVTRSRRGRRGGAESPLRLPSSLLPGTGAPQAKRPAGGSAGVAGAPSKTTSTPSSRPSSGSTTTTTQSQSNLLDYLLGGGS